MQLQGMFLHIQFLFFQKTSMKKDPSYQQRSQSFGVMDLFIQRSLATTPSYQPPPFKAFSKESLAKNCEIAQKYLPVGYGDSISTANKQNKAPIYTDAIKRTTVYSSTNYTSFMLWSKQKDYTVYLTLGYTWMFICNRNRRQ